MPRVPSTITTARGPEPRIRIRRRQSEPRGAPDIDPPLGAPGGHEVRAVPCRAVMCRDVP